MQPSITLHSPRIPQGASMELVPSIFIAATLVTTLAFAFDFIPTK